MRVPLGASIWADNNDSRTKILDEVPSSPSDGKYVGICVNVAKNFKSGVVLEQQIHFYTNASNILEHVGKLHVFRIGPKAIKTEKKNQIDYLNH